MKLTLLDGAMGTALIAEGLPRGALPERWIFERPAAVSRVHAAHRAAGAEVILTCTFNLASPRLAEEVSGRTVEEVAAAAVALTRAAAPGARVAGAVGPIWPPGAALDVEAAHAAAAAALARAGVDLLLLEAQPSRGAAALALAGARRTGLPCAVSFALREAGGGLVDEDGADGVEALAAADDEGAAVVGANCSLPGTPLAALLERAAGRVRVPLLAKPSAGLPGAVVAPERFGEWVAELARAGARWIGGCCGAGPEHLAAAARRCGLPVPG